MSDRPFGSSRLLHAVGLILIMLACLLGTAAVAAARPDAILAASPNGNCSNVTQQNLFSGHQMTNLNFSSITGVKGTAYSEDALYPCINSPATDVNLGSMYWIAIVPAPGNDDCETAEINCILQIGVVQCYDALYPGDICDDGGESTEHIFWAEGGCNGASPIVKELGPSVSGGIRLTIDRITGGSWDMYAEDSDTNALLEEIIVLGTNPETDCWASGTGDNVSAQWYCERWDGNDGCGDDGNKVSFINISHQNSAHNGTWYEPGEDGYGDTLTDADCNETTSEDFCDTDQGNDIRLWTQQGS